MALITLSQLYGCQIEQKQTPQKSVRQTADFNANWQFILDDNTVFSEVEFNDSKWQTLTLPHDWSIKEKFDEKYDGATAYLPGGTGWYRKHFTTEKHHENQANYLYFDGVYANSTVWINGQKLGGRINGYVPFYFDISDHLNPIGQTNTVAVRVEHENYIDSRWYTGSGIYRDVKLITTDKLHVDIWGSYITTPDITDKEAKVEFELTINNLHKENQKFDLFTQIFDQNHNLVATAKSKHYLAALSSDKQRFKHQMIVPNPVRWHTDNPHLYTAIHQIKKDDKIVDQYDTKFGIREILFDTNKGFFLNGVSMKIKGVNLHHGAGLVGAAIPDDVLMRRFLKLKEAGVNAIRTAHNPVSQRFLDICDELGLLVQAEIFDEWDNPKDKRLNQWERHDDEISRGYAAVFQTEAEADLKDSILRDRNHPSIIMWSIGNEIEWTYPRYKEATGYFDMNATGNYFFNPPFISSDEIKQRFANSNEGKYVLADTANKLSKWVKEIDTTRPVTANLILPSVSHVSGYTDALDVIGYSYRRVIYDYGHRLFPDKMIMGAENVVQWHEWQAIEEREFIAGTFLWTGIDYLGESHNAWPKKALESGMLDTAGFEKPSFHMMKTLWNKEPHIHITTQTEEKSLYKLGTNNTVVEKEPNTWNKRVWIWQDVNEHWNYKADEPIIVELLTNCEAVELWLQNENQKQLSLGVQTLNNNADHILKWALPFTPGKLIAKGINGCNTSAEIATASKPVRAKLSSDRSELAVDVNQVAHITVQLLDNKGNIVKNDDQNIEFILSDNLELLGTDNGNSALMKQYSSPKLLTNAGKALLIVRAKNNKPASVTLRANGLIANKIKIN
jgi:beta-galactosidase/beta-glucuronidase